MKQQNNARTRKSESENDDTSTIYFIDKMWWEQNKTKQNFLGRQQFRRNSSSRPWPPSVRPSVSRMRNSRQTAPAAPLLFWHLLPLLRAYHTNGRTIRTLRMRAFYSLLVPTQQVHRIHPTNGGGLRHRQDRTAGRVEAAADAAAAARQEAGAHQEAGTAQPHERACNSAVHAAAALDVCVCAIFAGFLSACVRRAGRCLFHCCLVLACCKRRCVFVCRECFQ